MIVALDVGYSARGDQTDGLCGVVAFSEWDAEHAESSCATWISDVAPYVPGRLYERELPCLLAGLDMLATKFPIKPTMLVVDGNVRLDQTGRPGLGHYLFEHFEQRIPVVGIAKSAFVGLDAVEVRRGTSDRPLYVTAAGIDEAAAAELVRSMTGQNRVPTMLRFADALSRDQDPFGSRAGSFTTVDGAEAPGSEHAPVALSNASSLTPRSIVITCELQRNSGPDRSFDLVEFVEFNDSSRVVIRSDRGWSSSLNVDEDPWRYETMASIEASVRGLWDLYVDEENGLGWIVAELAKRGVVTDLERIESLSVLVELSAEIQDKIPESTFGDDNC